jgi:tetratricopeptide (TPR) repeat protein
LQRPLSGLWLIIALILAIQLPALGNGFIQDDDMAITHNPVVTDARLDQVFSTDIWGQRGELTSGAYRPLLTLSFLAQWAISPNMPWSFHFVNMLLYLAVAVLVFKFLSRLTDERTAFVATALWAVHPAFSDVAFNIVQRSELLAALFGLAYLLVLWNPAKAGRVSAGRIGAASVLFAAALFSKEHAIMLPIMLFVLGVFGKPDQRKSVREVATYYANSIVVAILLISFYLVLRSFALGGLARETPFLFNPLVALPFVWRMLNSGWLLVHYLLRFFLPLPQPMDFGYNQLPIFGPSEVAFLAAVWMGLVILVSITAIGLSKRRIPALGLAWFVLVLAPAIQMLVPPNLLAADRLLFFPGIGLALATASLARTAADHLYCSPIPRLVVLASLLGLLVGCQLMIGERYHDNPTFFRYLAENAPDAAHVQAGNGKYLLLARHDAPRAVEAFTRAARIAPFVPSHWHWLGRALIASGHPAEAMQAFEQMESRTKPEALAMYRREQAEWLTPYATRDIRYHPEKRELLEVLNAWKPGDFGLSAARVEAVAWHEPESIDAMLADLKVRFEKHPDYTRFVAYVEEIRGRYEDAAQLVQDLLENNPDAVDLWWNLCRLSDQIGDDTRTRNACEELLKRDPANEQGRALLENLSSGLGYPAP